MNGETLEGFSHSLMTFPVVEETNAQGQRVRKYVPIPFKTLKELKSACAQYGPTAPFTETILQILATYVLPPNN